VSCVMCDWHRGLGFPDTQIGVVVGLTKRLDVNAGSPCWRTSDDYGVMTGSAETGVVSGITRDAWMTGSWEFRVNTLKLTLWTSEY
jgi:hypothetical protein